MLYKHIQCIYSAGPQLNLKFIKEETKTEKEVYARGSLVEPGVWEKNREYANGFVGKSRN